MATIENKFPGKDVSADDLKTKIPLVANYTSKAFRVAGVTFNGKKIPVMAGPNMVESEDLIVKTAKAVKKLVHPFLEAVPLSH